MAALHNELPDWACWLAQDADGSWWAYEAEPHQHDIGWYENEVGRCQQFRKADPAPDWSLTLMRVT